MRRSLPTERKVLRCIYNMYEASYPDDVSGENDPFLSIDVVAVAGALQCSHKLLFGYLYYYLEHKHRYQTGENSYVSFFAIKAGSKHHAVNFPYLAAILSAHDQEHSKFVWSLGVSIIALVLSIAAIVAQIVTAYG